jgi:heterogeneous nuclear rnp K-like protein 2
VLVICVGKEGATIKSIITDSGARVQISNQTLPNSTDKIVTVTGKVDALGDALKRIIRLIEQNPLKPSTRSFPYQPSFGTSTQFYPPSNIPPQYGYGPPAATGATAPHAQQYGAPAPLAFPFVSAGNVNTASQQPEVTQKIAIPTSSAGALIGRRGSTARTLRAQTGCNISIADADNSNPSERVVTLTGTSASIHAAIMAIRHLVDQYASSQTQNPSSVPSSSTAKPRGGNGGGGRGRFPRNGGDR